MDSTKIAEQDVKKSNDDVLELVQSKLIIVITDENFRSSYVDEF